MAPRRRKAPLRKRGGLRKRRNIVRKTDGGKVGFLRNTLVPDRMLCRLVYKDNIDLSSGDPSGYALWNGRMNSLYDIDYAIINGHQPLGYDQWNAFYNKCRVYKAVVSATFINNATAGIQCGLLPYNYVNGNLASVDDSTFEQPRVVTKTIAGSQGMNKAVLKKVVDIPRIMGKSHTQYKSEDNTAAVWNGNPQDLCNLAIFCRTINGASAPLCQVIIDITLYSEFFDRKQQNISYPQGKNPDGAFQGQVHGTFVDWRGSTMTYLQTLPIQFVSTISTP